MTITKLLMYAGLAVITVSLGIARASTLVNFDGSYIGKTFYPDLTRATVTCDTTCAGLVSGLPSSIVWSTTANMLSNSGNNASNEQTETAFVNSLLGTNFDYTTVHNVDTSSATTKTILSNAQYILFVTGTDPRYALLENIGGGQQSFTWNQVGNGAGLSHFVVFGGTASVVPIPATGLLLICALGAFGLVRKRRKAAA